jgi:predicted outer membrane repeat protein
MWLHALYQRWVGKTATARSVRTAAARRRGPRPGVRQLEGRNLLTNYTAAYVSDLVADINASNQSGGSNTITLTAPTADAYVLTTVNDTTDGNRGLPQIAAGDNLTIIGQGDTIDGNGLGVLDVANGATLILQNLTLQNGGAAAGGAVYNHGSLDLNGVTVQGNSATSGGAVYSLGVLTMEGGTVLQTNRAASGGALYVGAGTVNLSNVTLTANDVAGSKGVAYGGALYVAGGTVTWNTGVLSSNNAVGGSGSARTSGSLRADGNGGSGYGGGLFLARGTLVLTSVKIASNAARGGAGDAIALAPSGPESYGGAGGHGFGGGLYVVGGTLTLAGVTVSANLAQGGPADTGSGAVTTRVGGLGMPGGDGLGGALYVGGGTVNLTNATVATNTAQGGNGDAGRAGGTGRSGGPGGAGGSGLGGGVYVVGGTVNLISDTVSHNHCGGGQGATGGNGGPGTRETDRDGPGGSGGAGGNGGRGGAALGAGLFLGGGGVNLTTDSLSSNTTSGGKGSKGGLGGPGGSGVPAGRAGAAGAAGATGLTGGGDLYNGAAASLSLDNYSLNNPIPQTAGTYTTETIAVTGLSAPITAGTAGSFTVTIEDSLGNTLTGYTGTVHFTSSDPQAVLPADYTFTAADQGVHTFSATFKTAGPQSLTATDTVTASQTGLEIAIPVVPADVNRFVVNAPNAVTAGNSFKITVTAADQYGNTVPDYTGTVHFTSTDGKATLPADYTFTQADQGIHAFKGVILVTAGTRTIQATDTANSGLTGSANVKVHPSGVASLVVTAPSSVEAGVAFSITVTALDSYGNAVTTYAGTVAFSCTDAAATVPANYTFGSADKGKHVFKKQAILQTAGKQTITVNDTVRGVGGGSVFGSVVVNVI